jgi:hypothetical protein
MAIGYGGSPWHGAGSGLAKRRSSIYKGIVGLQDLTPSARECLRPRVPASPIDQFPSFLGESIYARLAIKPPLLT